MDEIDETARSYFLVKIANGGIPQRVAGGSLDGLEYFPIEVDGTEYWLTARGLFDPSECSDAAGGSESDASPTA